MAEGQAPETFDVVCAAMIGPIPPGGLGVAQRRHTQTTMSAELSYSAL
ncbi:hypothetical protein P4U43_06235 [Arthrobacter sp. EH-1B-1]|uniref:Uncharacterized protein n=1 Tax=Arthrobacter vasquezii TaxID=2977629 RepID=A0ABT6CTI9_9MICC|nr:hypothetical protein [Arthrobacter vasquezii]MDF9277390.1 hypothetical protein [Arthrobacter vasquezii]